MSLLLTLGRGWWISLHEHPSSVQHFVWWSIESRGTISSSALQKSCAWRRNKCRQGPCLESYCWCAEVVGSTPILPFLTKRKLRIELSSIFNSFFLVPYSDHTYHSSNTLSLSFLFMLLLLLLQSHNNTLCIWETSPPPLCQSCYLYCVLEKCLL